MPSLVLIFSPPPPLLCVGGGGFSSVSPTVTSGSQVLPQISLSAQKIMNAQHIRVRAHGSRENGLSNIPESRQARPVLSRCDLPQAVWPLIWLPAGDEM